MEYFRLTSFYDVDYVGDKVERKSTSRSCHFIGGNLVTWIYKKPGSTTLSIIEDKTCQLQVVVLSFGYRTNLKTTTSIRVKFLSFVIKMLPLVFLKIQHCIQEQNILEIKNHFIKYHV